MVNEQAQIRFANPRLLEMFEYGSEDELLGQQLEILLPEDLREKHKQLRHGYNKNPHPRAMGLGLDLVARKKDGSILPVEISLNPFSYGGEKLIAAFITDITPRKKLEAQLKEYTYNLEAVVKERTHELEYMNLGLQTQVQERKMAEEALRDAKKELETMLDRERELNELKSRFVSMASHEFRTPLSTILSSISLLERYNDPSQADKREKHFQRIRKSINDLTNILEDFLSIGKLEEGNVKAVFETLDFSKFVSTVLEELKGLHKPGQEVIFQPPGAMLIESDAKLLRHIITNLTTNAIKYSPENSTITVSLTDQGEYVRFSISDEGIGIPESEQKNMFTRFFRAGNVTNIQGTGLGLNIVKKSLDLINGDISFVSKQNEGTTFTVILPKINPLHDEQE